VRTVRGKGGGEERASAKEGDAFRSRKEKEEGNRRGGKEDGEQVGNGQEVEGGARAERGALVFLREPKRKVVRGGGKGAEEGWAASSLSSCKNGEGSANQKKDSLLKVGSQIGLLLGTSRTCQTKTKI